MNGRGTALCIAIAIAAIAATRGDAAELWRALTDGDIWDMDAIADLNGDGKSDVVAGCSDDLVRAVSGADGSVIWSCPTGVDSPAWCVASFPDLDGDGKQETLAGTGGNEFLVISSAGSIVWSQKTDGDVWCLGAVGDITGDGYPEVGVGAGDDRVRVFDLKARSSVWAAPRNLGSDIWSIDGGADLNADAIPDVVVGSALNAVTALSGKDGATIWSYDTNGDVWAVAFTGDVDRDGVADVLAATGAPSMLLGGLVLCLPGKYTSGGGGPGGGGAGQYIWRFEAASDVRVMALAPDYDGDGIREVVAGGYDDRCRLLRGDTGVELWNALAPGTIEDVIVAPDIDADGKDDVIFASHGSTVEAVSAADGRKLWRYQAETSAAFWSLARLPDVDGDGVADCAAGSALNIIFGLPGKSNVLLDPVSDFACVAAETGMGPGVLLTWVDPIGATAVRLTEVTGGVEVLLGEVPAGTQQFLAPLPGDTDPRDIAAVALGAGGESMPEICTVTLAPPPVVSSTCSFVAGVASVSWVLPDPGLRQLDGIRVLVNLREVALLPPTATSHSLGGLTPGNYEVVVRTVWNPWDSPPFTCILQIAVSAPFIRGDGNGDLKVDIGDVVFVLGYLFANKPSTCLASLDANGDWKQDISDPIYTLKYLFADGPDPKPPFPSCGAVVGADCASFPRCSP